MHHQLDLPTALPNQATTTTPPAPLPSLRLNAAAFRHLLEHQGPSLALWRAAEIAALRTQGYPHPILDLGCGDGLVTAMVLPTVAFGIDPDAHALARAARHGIYQQLLPVPVENAALPAGSVHTVFSNSVLEHLPNLPSVLTTIARLLRPDGQLIFTTPTAAFSRWLALPLPGYALWRNRQLAHLNLWSAERWTAQLEHVGLYVKHIQPYLRPSLVRLWDILELLQHVWIARRRLVGLLWRRIPPPWMTRLAHRVAQLELATPPPGGGHLIVARKPNHSPQINPDEHR